ncbi:hypothetical protein D9757_000086 [Collybiopsis confluens]|uniref:4'-phosphopantetheinyl transferase domain-containing protein n=1 Tax=Collybiopsis confluens TaxID=2823264 RepID=A0A8H5MGV9_9AGAR|nr:hypothetical protein D9757_000086 [Collybiopsis confluens]
MAILGIGVDVAHIPRFTAMLKRRGPDKLAQRILSDLELAHWHASHRRDHALKDEQYLAVRWALKEAAYKAVYPTFRPTWKDITYHSLGELETASKPCLSYKSHPNLTLHCSVSHDGDYVFATVIAEK